MLRNIAKFALVFSLGLLAASAASGQSQTNTNTNCNAYGSSIDCTSTSTTTQTGPTAAQVEQQKEMNENAAKTGAALGSIIAAKHAQHAQEKNDLTAVVFCRQNPSGTWTFPGKAPMSCETLGKNVVAYCTVNSKTPICKDVAKLGPAPVPAQVQAAVPIQTLVPVQEAPASIQPPRSDTSDAHSSFPTRWKSLTSGNVRTLRFEGDYIYAESVLPDDAAKAGVFFLLDAKKDGDKYVGKQNGHLVRADRGASCSVTWPFELTLVTPDRIEGRSFTPPANAKIDWNACSFSPSADWQPFTWIPVK